ncbi:efflux RND transporter periplasmic adaptor subunit [Propionivibrio limicola]|uniref:efflux RND transporter periplasmic adaptor subunit n=1 Tax=Propionivibrio limicola TaxID=167645 RepID=UPI0012925858|nr:efflux RND transporter periplasmic adaptor subunit [Propionivibrio limicola]
MNIRHLFLLLAGIGTAALAAGEILTAPVTQTPAADVYVADSTLQAIRQSVVSAQVSGRVLQLAVRAGDAVKAGQVIVRIDDRELVSSEASARAATSEAQANLARAELDLKRAQELAKRNFVSAAALDQAENAVNASRARVSSLRANAEAASTTRSHAVVTAPYDGYVASTSVDVGDMATPGKPLLTLFEPGKLRAVSYVPDTEMARLRARLSTTPPEIELSGKVVTGAQTTVLPAADPGTRTTEIRVDLPTGVAAVPGQFARTRFALPAVESVHRLSIPAAAVLRRGELTAVYVKTADGRFQQRQVRLGEAMREGRVEILSGLKAGEHVALEPVKAGIESATEAARAAGRESR